MWEPPRLTTLWAFVACYEIALPVYLTANPRKLRITLIKQIRREMT
jgi:hypothetical protein